MASPLDSSGASQRGSAEAPDEHAEKIPYERSDSNSSSPRSFIHKLYDNVYPDQDIETSSLFVFCKKVRKTHLESLSETWEPPRWQMVCPFPFCPTYRQFARLVGVTLVVLLLWGSAYVIIGEAFAPGGQLFGLAVLVIASHFGGWLVSLATLPGLVGMLLVGIIFQNVGLVQISSEYDGVQSYLRKIALVIILTRAGLDLDPAALKRLAVAVLKIGLVPWAVESAAIAVLTHFLLDLPWMWGCLLGVTIAAVSPAVVVACLVRLRGKGYGVAKGIPTLIIAISGIDDAVSVAAFGIISSLVFSEGTLTYQIAQGPVSIVLGLGGGMVWGKLAKYIPEKNDPFVVALRVLMLFGGGLMAVLGSENAGLSGAGPLAVVTAAFVSCHSWSQQGWDVEENPVATAFEIFWMIFEPILFGLTGTQIQLDQLSPRFTASVIGCLAASFVLRTLITVLVAIGDKLNLKEKLFIALSLMSKASVQAALAPVPGDTVRDSGDAADEDRADIFLHTCVLSILVSAPLVAILMTALGPRLLTKTAVDPQFPESWRKHTRPSLRDITVPDEDAASICSDRRRSGRSSRGSRRTTAHENKAVVCEEGQVRTCDQPPPMA